MIANVPRPSLFPTFFCLLAGISFGLIVLCYYHTPTEKWDQDLPGDASAWRTWLPNNALPSETANHETHRQLSKGSKGSFDEPFFSQRGEAAVEDKSLLHAVKAELDNFQADQEEEPDDSILEHGQDQSPEETERLKALRKEAEKKEKKDIQTVKEAVQDVIQQQKEAGQGVDTRAEKALEAIIENGRARDKPDLSKAQDAENDEAAEDRKKAASTADSGKKTAYQHEKEAIEAFNKEKAAQAYVESLEKAKAAGKPLTFSQKDKEAGKTNGQKPNIVSLAALSTKAAQDLVRQEKEKFQAMQQSLTADEQSFLYQMSDMLSISGGGYDSGGQSIQMKFLTEEEANAADSVEWNSKVAYGAREEDLVTFLEVKQGMDEDVPQSKLQAAMEGLPLLTIDLVKEKAKQDLVVVTCANWLYYDFVLNWVGHLRKLGVTNFLVGALDKQTSFGLAALGVPGFQMYPGGLGAVGLTTSEFQSELHNTHKLSRQKVALARLFTDFGYDIILSDVDVIWLKDPIPYFSEMKSANILTASNELTSTLKPGDLGLEMVEAVQAELSMSILFVRHSPESTKFVKEWDSMLAGKTDRVDQIAFNTLVAKYTTPLRTSLRNDRLATGPRRQLAVGVLPLVLFPNGHTYFIQGLHKKYGTLPYALHVNFNEGGLKGKRHRMRQAGMWLDAPSYFESSTAFLQVSVDKPGKPPREASDSDLVEFHLRVLDQQLVQVRAGIALAIALERTLILPELMCYCDRSWSGLEKCRAPGAPDTALPFPCPLDYVFDPASFDDAGRQHGHIVEIRDHSFFQHPKLPRKLKESTVLVLPAGTDPMSSRFSQLHLASYIHVPPKLPVEGLRHVLDSQMGVQVLAFPDADQLFGGFGDREWAASVSKRIARLSGVWCCSRYGSPRKAYGMDADINRLLSPASQAL